MIIDLGAGGLVLRVLKGYRNAECAIIQDTRPEEGRAEGGGGGLLLVVHLPKRGIVEVWPMPLGTRHWAATTESLVGKVPCEESGGVTLMQLPARREGMPHDSVVLARVGQAGIVEAAAIFGARMPEVGK